VHLEASRHHKLVLVAAVSVTHKSFRSVFIRRAELLCPAEQSTSQGPPPLPPSPPPCR